MHRRDIRCKISHTRAPDIPEALNTHIPLPIDSFNGISVAAAAAESSPVRRFHIRKYRVTLKIAT